MWYFICNKKKVGPVPLEQLRQLLQAGKLRTEDHVLREGARKWVPLGEAIDAAQARQPKPPTAQPARVSGSSPSPPAPPCAAQSAPLPPPPSLNATWASPGPHFDHGQRGRRHHRGTVGLPRRQAAVHGGQHRLPIQRGGDPGRGPPAVAGSPATEQSVYDRHCSQKTHAWPTKIFFRPAAKVPGLEAQADGQHLTNPPG